MSDPPRLRYERGSDGGRLLASVPLESATAAAKRETLAALGLGAGVGAIASTAAAGASKGATLGSAGAGGVSTSWTTTLVKLVLSKKLTLATLAVVVVGAAATTQVVHRSGATPAPQAASSIVGRSHSAPSQGDAVLPSPPADIVQARPVTPEDVVAPSPSAAVLAPSPVVTASLQKEHPDRRPTASAPIAANTVSTAVNGRLAEEVRLLDAARLAMRQGKTAESLHWIAQHERTFPQGDLARERELLREEVIAKSK